MTMAPGAQRSGISDQEISPQALGHLGEIYLAGQLVDRGAVVSTAGPADLLVNDIPVEVKTARFRPYRSKPNRRLGYQFCIRRDGRHGLRAPFLVLICWTDPPYRRCPIFIVPDYELNGHLKLTIPNDPEKYAGRWARWLDLWELIT